jgi:hypothetical protein
VAFLDRRRHPPVKRENTLEIRALFLRVLSTVVVDSTASVHVMSAGVISAHVDVLSGLFRLPSRVASKCRLKWPARSM